MSMIRQGRVGGGLGLAVFLGCGLTALLVAVLLCSSSSGWRLGWLPDLSQNLRLVVATESQRPGFEASAVNHGGSGVVAMSVDDRKQLWRQVEEAQQAGLPRTAIEHLQAIQQSAAAEGADAEALKALGLRLATEASLDQPAIPKMIRGLEQALPELPESTQPLAKGLLAHWYFGYYQQNRWRFANRSRTEAPPGDDFETWDLPRFLEYVDQLFQASLEDAQTLQSLPIEQFTAILTEASVSDAHRPTLYDFLAYQALAFFELDEQIVRQQDAFQISADGPIFGSTEEFVNWQPETEDQGAMVLQAVRIYQSLLRFHAQDDDPTAVLDADLHRLRFGDSVAFGSQKTARYRAALQRFVEANGEHPLSAVALAQIARIQWDAGQGIEAHRLATRGLRLFPDSLGGRQCHNLLQEIEARELTIQTERIWNRAGPELQINARNLSKVHFRLIPFDYDNWQWGMYREPTNMEHEQRQALVGRESVAQWTVDLPQRDDYQKTYLESPVEVDFPSGCYLLLASGREDFTEQDNQLSITEVWVSDLAILLREDYYSAEIVGQVVDALSGRPQAEAVVRVEAWVQDGRNSRTERRPDLSTDANGFFRMPKQPRTMYKLTAQVGEQKLGVIDGRGFAGRSRPGEPIQQQVLLFTDRAIYRPGQTIQFKGIVHRADQERNRYDAVPNRRLKVGLFDANQQLIEQMDVTSNAYGSFSGSFTAPRDRVLGQMRIGMIEGEYQGNQLFRVEEYKRPRFFTEVLPPDEQFQLNQQVVVKGQATAYTGAPIDGATVRYRVVRQVRFPDWWWRRCWYCPPLRGESQEIAQGTLTTHLDGSFEVPFTAAPDRSVDPEGQPIFSFTIYADVTDSAGETRSGETTIRLGYTSLEASLAMDAWATSQDEIEFRGRVTNLDGRPQQVAGLLTVHRMQQPEEVHRAALEGWRSWRIGFLGDEARLGRDLDPKLTKPDMSQIQHWQLGEEVQRVELQTDGEGRAAHRSRLEAGPYRVRWSATDASGQEVWAERFFQVIDPAATTSVTKVPHYLEAEKWSAEPGQTFTAIWGTGYDQGQAFVQWIHRGQVLKEFWTDPQATQVPLEFTPQETHRGGLILQVTFLRDNRAYIEQRSIDVPWTNKDLTIKWERFVSKLQPGQQETWTAVIQGPQAEAAVAEMVATLYDASLEAFVAHRWPNRFSSFYRDHGRWSVSYTNRLQTFNIYHYGWQRQYREVSFSYRQFDHALMVGQWGWDTTILGAPPPGAMFRFGGGAPVPMAAARGQAGGEAMEADFSQADLYAVEGIAMEKSEAEAEDAAQPVADLDLDQVQARQNLEETAFFFPHLLSDENGTIRMEFQMPEALTRWRFMGFAHDRQLRSTLLSDEAVTSKDLMVQPNPPRFLREGDLLEFSVKIVNQSATRQTGRARLTLSDMQTDESMNAALGVAETEQSFDVPAGQSTSLYWRLTVPDFVGVLSYRVVAATERLSDGEEGYLPVLSKRILVSEALPLPIRGPETKEFNFQSLLDSADRETLRSQTLTVQMTSNPTWYAVMALPYLMENPHQNSESLANRFYANALARHIANSQPRIRRIFQQWQGTDALDSPLEKNEDLKSVLIQQTPWLLDAKRESQARRNVAILFDDNRLNEELARIQQRLGEMQMSDGSWPWFPGGPANDYMTLYIATSFGRLQHLGVEVDTTMAVRALDRLDDYIDRQYQRIVRDKRQEDNNLNSTIALYLYTRSFFLRDHGIADKHRPAVDYFRQQARLHWLSLGSRQSQGHVALALHRFGDRETPGKIVASLTERSLSDPEMGMFWREGQAAWRWYEAPIETQALMIELYDEVAADPEKVDDLKVWLLKQKQTRNWKTSKGTADAIYALLLRGTSGLASTQQVEVTVGGTKIQPQQVEAGTGFYQERLVRAEIQPEMGRITVSKQDPGVAWGSVHWQYLEDISQIQAYAETPLKVTKSLYRKVATPQGPTIQALEGMAEVGDQIVVRLELRTDRDLEYVHLRDDRGSGTEPVDVLSQYRFQDGLGYYQSTRDTASHFFVDYLPRGVYVFEYSVRVQHRGEYQTGMAWMECLYAPEFNGHSQSLLLEVQ